MTTQNTKTKEQLLTEKDGLLTKLRSSRIDNYDEIMPLLRDNELQLKHLAKVELLRQVNTKYSRLRDIALQAWECEQPAEDITCSDSSFHKTKVKKYPKIAALSYTSAKWEDSRIVELRINGEKFRMYRQKYEYNKDTEYIRPESFTDFLALNSIPAKDITLTEYNEISEKLNDLNIELKTNIEKYKNSLESLNYSNLNYWGLIGQHPLHLYEYTPNK